MKKILIGLLLVSACASHQPSNPIMARSLVSTSDEKISFPISDTASVNAAEKWIVSGDTPSAAELSCKASAKSCKNTKALLKKHKIDFNEVTGEGDAGNLSLTYSRIAAKECNIEKFGCATAGNSLKMITDRQQIVKPALSDPQDAARAVKAVNKSLR